MYANKICTQIWSLLLLQPWASARVTRLFCEKIAHVYLKFAKKSPKNRQKIAKKSPKNRQKIAKNRQKIAK
jgi:hypothetical protein